jgi:LPXTG-motif cell wall-anchored protein
MAEDANEVEASPLLGLIALIPPTLVVEQVEQQPAPQVPSPPGVTPNTPHTDSNPPPDVTPPVDTNPEPTSLVIGLVGAAASGLTLLYRRRRRRKAAKAA